MKTTRLLLVGLTLIAGFCVSCTKTKKPVQPEEQIPSAPTLLAATHVEIHEVTLHWNDESDDEDGFWIELREGTTWTVLDSVGENVETFTAANLSASTNYRFRVWSYNGAGNSDSSSNEINITTDSEELPLSPNNVIAEAQTPTVVWVTWNDRSNGAEFIVSRRIPTADWSSLDTLPDNTTLYIDSAAVPETDYYYRVGSHTEAGTSWSTDSAFVSTPALGAPQPPESLRITVFVGTGVQLDWLDRSIDETGFHISRNLSGQNYVIIDSVSANTTTYFDSLSGNPGIYSYRVRAANSFGNSTWCQHTVADYRYCSSGVIPVCIGNFWTYDESGVSGDREVSVRVADVGYRNGADYYLLVENPANDPDNVDTLEYVRNEHDGHYITDHPLSAANPVNQLFRYPPGLTSQPYFCGEDSVRVLLINTTILVGDSTFSGLILYQRWIHGTPNSYRYHVSPGSLGVVREDYNEGATTLRRREIREWWVQN